MRQHLLSLGAILALAIITCFQYVNCYDQCLKPAGAAIDQAWFGKAAAQGFHIVNQGECVNCGNPTAWKWSKSKPNGFLEKEKMCWNLDITCPHGDFKFPLSCKFHNVNEKECVLDLTTDSYTASKVQLGGFITITQTDNRTYIAGIMCVFGKENTWWIMGTKANTILPPGTQNQILEDFSKLGLNTTVLPKKGVSSIYINGLIAVPHSNCKF